MAAHDAARGADERFGLGYQPSLDGIRGLSIALVLCFHGGWRWMQGGYVGVSVFFTLSGFLITSLLLDEFDRTGRIDLARFFSRRVRRLLPASLACLAAVSVVARIGWVAATDRLRGDIVAAALQVANWRALTGTQSYADLVAALGGAVGPVDHFWSLSIEEQFYWVWPACALASFSTVRSARGRIAVLASLTGAAAVAALLIAATAGGDSAYWSTPARLGEILAGATLAAVLRHRSMPGRLAWMGWPALAVVVWAAVTWPSGSGPAYEGWLPLFAVASCVLVAAALPHGLVRRMLSVRPLVSLGAVSYGVYLYHWPVFAILDEQRLGIDGLALFAARLAATGAVSWISYRWIEQPIRHRALPLRIVAPVALAATGAVVAVALVAAPRPMPTFAESLDTEGAGFVDDVVETAPTDAPTTIALSGADPASTGSQPAETALPVSRPVRLLLIGDSTAVALGAGLVEWARREPEVVRVESVAAIGCGVIQEAPLLDDEDGRFIAACRDAMGPALDTVLESGSPEVAVVLVTLPDGGRRQWSEREGPLQGTDARYRERRRAAYDALVARLENAGVRRVILLIPPAPNNRWMGYVGDVGENMDIEGLQSMIAELDLGSATVEALDLASWLEAEEAAGAAEGMLWRSDGLHLDPAAAGMVVDRLLAPAILAAADAR